LHADGFQILNADQFDNFADDQIDFASARLLAVGPPHGAE